MKLNGVLTLILIQKRLTAPEHVVVLEESESETEEDDMDQLGRTVEEIREYMINQNYGTAYTDFIPELIAQSRES